MLKDIVAQQLKLLVPNTRKFLLGFTGGVDSSVLLHLFASFTEFQVRAVHIYNNRNVNKKDIVIEASRRLGVDIVIDSFIYKTDRNVEATGRKLRYEKIQSILSDDEVFITAHHLDDNIENFFIRLLRASGIDGLSSIQAKREFGKSFHIRPLLSVPKSSLIDYATKNNLVWLEDYDNNDMRFTRNIIRKKILPQVELFFPHYQASIAKSISHLNESSSLLKKHASCDTQLSIAYLNKLSIQEKSFEIRTWIKANTGHSVDTHIIDEVIKQATSSSKKLSIPIKKSHLITLKSGSLTISSLESKHWDYSSRSKKKD